MVGSSDRSVDRMAGSVSLVTDVDLPKLPIPVWKEEGSITWCHPGTRSPNQSEQPCFIITAPDRQPSSIHRPDLSVSAKCQDQCSSHRRKAVFWPSGEIDGSASTTALGGRLTWSEPSADAVDLTSLPSRALVKAIRPSLPKGTPPAGQQGGQEPHKNVKRSKGQKWKMPPPAGQRARSSAPPLPRTTP